MVSSQFKIPHKNPAKDVKKADEEKKVFKNFEVIVSIGGSPLIKAKLHVSRSIPLSLEPCLIKYQTSSAMIPFLFDDMKYLLNALFGKVMKSDLINEMSAKKIVAFDFRKEDNLLPI